MRTKIAAVILVLVSSCFGQQVAKLNFITSRGLMLVNVEVNGKPAIMLFDTGATHTVISLPLSGMKERLVELKANASGTTGQAFDVEAELFLDSVKVSHAPCLAANVDNVSRDLGVHVDGILGIDITGKFKNIDIDLKAKTITLSR